MLGMCNTSTCVVTGSQSSTTRVTQKFCYGDEDTKIEHQMGLTQLQDVIMYVICTQAQDSIL